MALYNEIIKSTDTPILVRFNGVSFPSYDNIIVDIGTEQYTLQSNPDVVITNSDDITLLEIRAGVQTSLANGSYLLKVEIVNADYNDGLVLTDCVINNLQVIVRDKC